MSVYKGVEQAVRLQVETVSILVDQGAAMYLRAYLEAICTR